MLEVNYEKGIWWLFGGIGLSAIVFAVLLATNVVSLHDNSSMIIVIII